MAALHAAFKGLGPIKFSDLPTGEQALESWLAELYTQCQQILDSIPIADPSESTRARSSSTSVASNASEITASSARPPSPSPENLALQKEWGKPIKLGAKENALGMSVYKAGAKDGKGAWFARRSVHEGIAFSKFKTALEMEFPESLAVQGAPGEGNVRGIGGETKVEDIKVPSKGRVEVYRLSAQFPGPTTPRDFVTLLVTSENAMKPQTAGKPVPRHYMIVSKPCEHPETQPQEGFVRGFYESVEFIREIPKQGQRSQDLSDTPHGSSQEDAIGKSAMIRNAEQKTKSFPLGDESHLSGGSGETSRKRSSTSPAGPSAVQEPQEINPVEWIMVTRSDPGGSVPRFMVERGTPGSICADAEKFLNWACQQDFKDQELTSARSPSTAPNAERRDSFQSFRSSRLAGVEGEHEVPSKSDAQHIVQDQPHVEREAPVATSSAAVENGQTGILSAVSGAAQYLGSYTPQVVLDHLPGHHVTSSEGSKEQANTSDDVDDTVSEASFESADSHRANSGSEVESPSSSRTNVPMKSDDTLNRHEKEILKLEQRKADLDKQFSQTRQNLGRDASLQTHQEDVEAQKAAQKHERELKKHQEKYEKELRKIDEKHTKERKKLEDKKRKALYKDEKFKISKERDEARQELELVRKEAALLRMTVEDLQRQNTLLVAKLGKAGLADDVSVDGISSPAGRESHKEKGRKSTASSVTSLKSQ